MNYTLGEVTKLLGLSKSAIRNYENQGLLKVLRKENNNYRSFTEEDIWILREIRSFRENRFSLEEICRLIGNVDADGMQGLLQGKRRSLLKEMAELLKQIEKLEHLEKNVRMLNPLHQPEICPMPAFYWLENTKENLDIQKSWIGWMPYVFASPLISEPDKNPSASMGLGLSEEDAQELRISIPSKACRLSASRAVKMTVAMADNTLDGYYDMVRSMSAYARACQYQPQAKALVQGIITLRNEQGEKRYYSRIWLPLQD